MRDHAEPAPAPSAAGAGGSTADNQAAAPAPQSAEASGRRMEKAAPPLSDDLAATGSGRRVDHEVTRVTLNLESSPAGSVELRYEYHDALVKLGVLPHYDRDEQALARRERARGFSDNGFCPEPPRPRW